MSRSLFAAAVLHSLSEKKPDAFFESTPDKTEKSDIPGTDKKNAIFEAVANRATQDFRALAASMLVGWVKDGSADADDFDALAVSMAGLDDLDDDADPTDEQVDAYNDALSALADAAVALGADQDDVTAMIDDDDDDAAERVFDDISENTEGDSADDSIAEYAVSADADEKAMFESSIKVVRNGVVKIIKKRLRPQRRTALQKAALKKARLRAHTASGKMAFRKSMKIRHKRGL